MPDQPHPANNRNLPAVGAAPRRAWRERRLLRPHRARAVRLAVRPHPRRPRGGAGGGGARRNRRVAGRAHHAAEHPGAARAPDRGRHGAARRHRRGASGHFAGRIGQGVPERSALAAGGLQRHARRSDRHGAHPRPDRVHGPRAAIDAEKNAKRKKPLPAGLDLKAVDLAHAAVVGQDHARDAVRAAVDAGARPAGQDAGDAHPSCAGGRRIWRHRRPRFDGGHRRADRRRDRRRARRGRQAGGGAPARRLVRRRRARQLSKT